MGGLKDSLTSWMSPSPDRGGPSMPVDDGRHRPREDRWPPTRGSETPTSEPTKGGTVRKLVYLTVLTVVATMAFQSVAAAQYATSDSPGDCSGAEENLEAETGDQWEGYLFFVQDVGGCITTEGAPIPLLAALNYNAVDPQTGERIGLVKDLDPDLSGGANSITYQEFCGAFSSYPIGTTPQQYYDQEANAKEQAILDPDGDGQACTSDDESFLAGDAGQQPDDFQYGDGQPPQQPAGQDDPCANPIGGLVYVPAVNGCLVVETVWPVVGIINGPVYDADTWRENREDLGIFKDLVDIDDMDEQIGLDVTYEEFCGAFPTLDVGGGEVDGVSLGGLTAQEYYDQLANTQEQEILDPNADGQACTSEDGAFLSGDTGDGDETQFEQTWTGQITQTDEAGNPFDEYTVEADIMPVSEMTGDLVGEVVGEVSYDDPVCSGVWVLEEVNEDSVQVQEQIEEGVGDCIEFVPLTLTPQEDGTLEYYFESDFNDTIGRGVLTLQGGSAPDDEPEDGGDPRLPSEIVSDLGMTDLPDTGGPALLPPVGGLILGFGLAGLVAIRRRT